MYCIILPVHVCRYINKFIIMLLIPGFIHSVCVCVSRLVEGHSFSSLQLDVCVRLS